MENEVAILVIFKFRAGARHSHKGGKGAYQMRKMVSFAKVPTRMAVASGNLSWIKEGQKGTNSAYFWYISIKVSKDNDYNKQIKNQL